MSRPTQVSSETATGVTHDLSQSVQERLGIPEPRKPRTARVKLIEREDADGTTRKLLDAVNDAYGVIPNVAKVLANSPAALNAYLQFSTALTGGVLSAQLQDQVKLAVSEANSCDYCKAALCAIGSAHGLTAADLLSARKAESPDPKTEAILQFASELVKDNGHVNNDAVQRARRAGASDAEIVETVAVVVNAFFTNYINNALQTEVDFPPAGELVAVGAACSAGESECSQ